VAHWNQRVWLRTRTRGYSLKPEILASRARHTQWYFPRAAVSSSETGGTGPATPQRRFATLKRWHTAHILRIVAGMAVSACRAGVTYRVVAFWCVCCSTTYCSLGSMWCCDDARHYAFPLPHPKHTVATHAHFTPFTFHFRQAYTARAPAYLLRFACHHYMLQNHRTFYTFRTHFVATPRPSEPRNWTFPRLWAGQHVFI